MLSKSRKISFGGGASRNRLKIVHPLHVDLLVPVALANPILSGQVVALHRQRKQTVVPKLVVVVEVLVPQREAEQPLGDQLPHRVLDALLAPVVSVSRRVRPSARSRSSVTPP